MALKHRVLSEVQAYGCQALNTWQSGDDHRRSPREDHNECARMCEFKPYLWCREQVYKRRPT